MKRFWYEMLVANVVMFLALIATCLVWVVWTSLVGCHTHPHTHTHTHKENAMSKFNEQKQIEETTEYQTAELIDELNKEKTNKVIMPETEYGFFLAKR